MELRNSYDIIVAGAGIAGICAAVKAAREGASALLIEHYAFLGGMSTAGMVSPFMKYSIDGRPLVGGIFEEIESAMRSLGGMIDNGFYAHAFRMASFQLLESAGVHMLLLSDVASVERTGNEMISVTTLTGGYKKTIKGSYFIDTTGDAQLLYLANFPWVKGDEKTGLLQALTLFFRMGGIDMPVMLDYVTNHQDDFLGWMTFDFDQDKIISVAGYHSFIKKGIAEGRLPKELEYIFFTTLPQSGEGSFNTTNVLGLDGSTSFDLTKAELMGREQTHSVVTLLQNEVPGFEKSYVIETAVQIGVRETRRAVGDYVVTGEDVRSGRKFSDAIARGCYGIDIHGQAGESSRLEDLPEGQYYDVPAASLIVRDADNLLVAGRCLSATREAHSALRIMATAAATGEACGAWAALSAKKKLPLRKIGIKDIQELVRHNISD